MTRHFIIAFARSGSLTLHARQLKALMGYFRLRDDTIAFTYPVLVLLNHSLLRPVLVQLPTDSPRILRYLTIFYLWLCATSYSVSYLPI